MTQWKRPTTPWKMKRYARFGNARRREDRDEQRTVAYRVTIHFPKLGSYFSVKTTIYVRRFIVASFKLTELRQIM